MALWELTHNAGLTLGDRLQGKMNPLGSPYNDKKSEKNSGWRSFRSLHVINDNSYCRALFNQLVDFGV